MPFRLAYVAPHPSLPSHPGEAVGVEGALEALDQQAEHAEVPGSAVEWGLRWAHHDAHDPRWMPQGLTTSAHAAPGLRERRLLLSAAYRRGPDGAHVGSRVSLLDLDSLRYRHVRLVRPTRNGPSPLVVHAGGLAWWGEHLFVAATRKGLGVARLDDLTRVADPRAPGGRRFELPVRAWLRAEQDDEEPLRYSFCDVDVAGDRPVLLVGEYGRRGQTRRVVRLALDPATGLPRPGDDGVCRAEDLAAGPLRMQGLAVVDGVHHMTSSNGAHRPGTLHVGQGESLRSIRGALPPGPEDLTWWPQTGLLWSQTEHPGHRYVFAVRPPP